MAVQEQLNNNSRSVEDRGKLQITERGAVEDKPDRKRKLDRQMEAEESVDGINPAVNGDGSSKAVRLLEPSLLTESETIINDNIHGTITVPRVCKAIMNTPQFDRLRSLHQLGVAHYVFPSADHSRYSHSIGVMHLAGKVADHLIKLYPSYMDNKDRICLMVAGLCHDLGHGPFSHLWEGFVGEARPDTSWKHEESSVNMLDHLINANNLMPLLNKEGIDDQDMLFIKELIHREQGETPVGRGPHKYFLYQVVANKETGVDVDKWDYIMRDRVNLGVHSTFQYERVLSTMRLTEQDGRLVTTFRDKVSQSLGNMFEDRARLHQVSYQHVKVKIIERMMIDMLLLADSHCGVEGCAKLSEATDSPATLEALTDDHLLRMVQRDGRAELAPARQLLGRIISRDLYTVVAKVPGPRAANGRTNVGAELAKLLAPLNEQYGNELGVIRKEISCGLGGRNPLRSVCFYGKTGQPAAVEDDRVESLAETAYYVFSRTNNAQCVESAKDAIKMSTEL